jgi:hypothetical protein
MLNCIFERWAIGPGGAVQPEQRTGVIGSLEGA